MKIFKLFLCHQILFLSVIFALGGEERPAAEGVAVEERQLMPLFDPNAFAALDNMQTPVHQIIEGIEQKLLANMSLLDAPSCQAARACWQRIWTYMLNPSGEAPVDYFLLASTKMGGLLNEIFAGFSMRGVVNVVRPDDNRSQKLLEEIGKYNLPFWTKARDVFNDFNLWWIRHLQELDLVPRRMDGILKGEKYTGCFLMRDDQIWVIAIPDPNGLTQGICNYGCPKGKQMLLPIDPKVGVLDCNFLSVSFFQHGCGFHMVPGKLADSNAFLINCGFRGEGEQWWSASDPLYQIVKQIFKTFDEHVVPLPDLTSGSSRAVFEMMFHDFFKKQAEMETQEETKEREASQPTSEATKTSKTKRNMRTFYESFAPSPDEAAHRRVQLEEEALRAIMEEIDKKERYQELVERDWKRVRNARRKQEDRKKAQAAYQSKKPRKGVSYVETEISVPDEETPVPQESPSKRSERLLSLAKEELTSRRLKFLNILKIMNVVIRNADPSSLQRLLPDVRARGSHRVLEGTQESAPGSVAVPHGRSDLTVPRSIGLSVMEKFINAIVNTQ